MGNQPQLAQLLGLPVVCDFRKQDVNYGGQGAPLVPIGDALLFKKFSSCLNLGGFANVSFSKNKKTIAFDIGAVNTVLNLLAQQLNKPFDEGGKLARSGQCITPLMARLNAIDFYQKKPPKSLGIEWVNAVVMPLLVEFNTSKTEDLLTTYTLHIAKQIGQQFKKEDTVLVTGGGAKNTYLLECIKKNSEAQFILPEDEIIDFKEALIFGFLGVLRLRNEINCLASVTGASKDHSSGTIFYP
jgi:anhydro-N-acetylmuramic acid kinase